MNGMVRKETVKGILDAGQDAKTEILVDGLCLRGDVLRFPSIYRACGFFLVLGVAVARSPVMTAATLGKATEDGYRRYVQATELRIDGELARPSAFLYIDGIPESRRNEGLAALKRGEIYGSTRCVTCWKNAPLWSGCRC